MSTENKLVHVLRAVHRLQVQQAPKQHRLRTPQCPSLPRFATALHEGWTPEERAHVEACPYCQMLLAADRLAPDGENGTGQPVPGDRVLETVLSWTGWILASIHAQQPHVPATLLYNEGWLLRLLLSTAARGVPCLPDPIQPGARWFSGALLYSAFLARRGAHRFAETHTHADGVVGHFDFAPGSKCGLVLNPGCSQFVVYEAKLFSRLSSRTIHAPDFDQAARTVACMAETLRRAGQPLTAYSSLGFYVLAPRVQKNAGVFDRELNKESIRGKIAARVARYDGPRREELERWQAGWVAPLLERLTPQCIDWESLIEPLRGHDPGAADELHAFYELCLKFNARRENDLVPGEAHRARDLIWMGPGGEQPVTRVRRGPRNTRIRLADGSTLKVPNSALRPRTPPSPDPGCA